MTIKYNKNAIPNFYCCATTNIKGAMLLVEQMSKKGKLHVKLGGGTFMGPYENWLARGEGGNYYDIFCPKDIKRKIISSLYRAFEKFTSDEVKETFPRVADWAMECCQNNPPKIHLLVKWIEELGIIPIAATHLCETPHGEHIKYAFEVTQAVSFSAEKGEFISLEKASDIPLREIDFICGDLEVKRTMLLSLYEARASNFAWGIHSEARDVLFTNWQIEQALKNKYYII
jgi:hypothetical protein